MIVVVEMRGGYWGWWLIDGEIGLFGVSGLIG